MSKVEENKAHSKKEISMVTITVNGVDIEVPQGELIVESVKRLGLDIPIFCYHPRMQPVGMCRMCLVEVGTKGPDGSVRMMPKPQAACTLPASNGLIIYTDTEKVHKDRKGVLEFLLINHPLDCPVCDKGGECPLQNNVLFYGPSNSRYQEEKRHAPKALPLSKYVTLDLERCIQCGRCVRFTEEISGDHQLAFRFRGNSMQPTTFQLTDFDSKFSGNTIEICPVGALTNSEYRFRARPWDIETSPSVCTECSNGCNVWFDHRSGKMVRINGRTNEQVNEEWTCDKGKFGLNHYNSEKRLKYPLIRKNDKLVRATWEEAYDAILTQFRKVKDKGAVLVKPNFGNEGQYLLQKLFRGCFESNNIDHRWTRNLQSVEDRLENKANISQVSTSIADFENKKQILVFGTSLADDLPILYLRVRKAVTRKGAKLIQLHSASSELDSISSINHIFPEGSELAVATGILKSLSEKRSVELPAEVKESLDKIDWNTIKQQSKLAKKDYKAIVDMIVNESTAIVTSKGILNVAESNLIDILGGISALIGAEFNFYGMQANGEGSGNMGVLPDMLPGGINFKNHEAVKQLLQYYPYTFPVESGLDTNSIIDGCASKMLKCLWLVDADIAETYYNSKLAKKALESVNFLVYQGSMECETMHYASVVLPMHAPAESDGTFTNMERRVQNIKQILTAPGESKSAWRIFADLLIKSGLNKSYFSVEEIQEEIVECIEWYAPIKQLSEETEGVLLKRELSSKLKLGYLADTLNKINISSENSTDEEGSEDK